MSTILKELAINELTAGFKSIYDGVNNGWVNRQVRQTCESITKVVTEESNENIVCYSSINMKAYYCLVRKKVIIEQVSEKGTNMDANYINELLKVNNAAGTFEMGINYYFEAIM